MLAYTADGWTELIVALSIFVPVVLATVLTVWVIRSAKNDPDDLALDDPLGEPGVFHLLADRGPDAGLVVELDERDIELVVGAVERVRPGGEAALEHGQGALRPGARQRPRLRDRRVAARIAERPHRVGGHPGAVDGEHDADLVYRGA